MRVLLSVFPEFAEGILNGTKRFEYRKSSPKRGEARVVMLYATKPVGRVVGEFEIARVLVDHPSALWDRTNSGSGISREYFNSYFEGRKQAFALEVRNPKRYSKPLTLVEVSGSSAPPQSFRYVG